MSVFNKLAKFASEDHTETDELGITLEDIREICTMHTALCRYKEAERNGYRYCKVDDVLKKISKAVQLNPSLGEESEDVPYNQGLMVALEIVKDGCL